MGKWQHYCVKHRQGLVCWYWNYPTKHEILALFVLFCDMHAQLSKGYNLPKNDTCFCHVSVYTYIIYMYRYIHIIYMANTLVSQNVSHESWSEYITSTSCLVFFSEGNAMAAVNKEDKPTGTAQKDAKECFL